MVVPKQSVKSPFWFVTGNIKVLMLCRVLWSWSTSIVYPYFSLYILALGGTSTEVGLISSLGLLAGMFLYPVGGYIADRAGRVKLIGFSTALYTSSHLLFVFANNWQTIALGQFFGQLLLFYVPAMNALQADSLPLGVRGKGFAVMMAVPGAIRVIAPYMGGWIINSFSSGGLTPDEALIKAVRICWGAATVIGFLVAAIRFKYLKETITEESRESVSLRGVPRIIKEAYLSI